jgi:hypothetical protein
MRTLEKSAPTKTIKIGRGFLGLNLDSPTDGAGLELPAFSTYQTYHVDRNKVDRICEKLYSNVLDSVGQGSLGSSKARLIKYRDNISLEERKYIIISHNTASKTRISVFIRFLSCGDNLYIGLDTYVLGGLAEIKFFLAILVILLFLVPVFIWIKALSRIRHEGDFWIAMRQTFPGKMVSGPFDFDDIVRFSKSALHSSAIAIREVMVDEGLPIDNLDSFVQNINNINVSTGGGNLSMTGSTIGMSNKK